MKRNINNLVKLTITFDEPIDGIHAESLWATPMKKNRYRLENNSVMVDLRFGDMVSAEWIDGILEFQSFILRDATSSPAPEFEELS